MAYYSLKEKSRYLKEIQVGSNKILRQDEITLCDEYADAVIEGKLGKSWETGSVPNLIEQIADMLASAKAFRFLHTGVAAKQADSAKTLKEEAFDLLDKIRSGDLGLKMPNDNTWDKDYPGQANREDKIQRGFEILL